MGKLNTSISKTNIEKVDKLLAQIKKMQNKQKT